MKALTYKQYKILDLVIFAVLLFILEFIVSKAGREWYADQLYTLSVTLTVMCLVLMRWSGYAAISALAGGLAICLSSGAVPEQYAIYLIGNCFGLLSLFYLYGRGKENVRENALRSILFCIITYLCVQFGRTIVALVLGYDILIIKNFLAADALSALLSIIAVLAARHSDGLFEDQKHYLFRLDKEAKAKYTETQTPEVFNNEE